MHSKFALKSGVAFAALVLGMQLAVAQSPTDFNQSSYNYGTINNDLSGSVPAIGSGYFSGGGSGGGAWFYDNLNLGTGASVSIGATGSVAAVSMSSINTSIPYPTGGVGVVNQTSSNEGDIRNFGGSTSSGNTWFSGGSAFTIDIGYGSLAHGASVSISATGAVAAVSTSALDDGTNGGPLSLAGSNVGGVYQWGSDTGFTPTTHGTNTHNYGTDPGVGVYNNGNVYNRGEISNVGQMANGASVSVSASGAVASVSTSVVGSEYLGSGGFTSFSAPSVGFIGQWVQNDGVTYNSGLISLTGSAGISAGISVSATGAVASVSSSFINTNVSGGSFDYTWQGAHNTDTTANYGTINLGGNSLGQASSASVSATGAVAAFSFSAVSDDGASVAFPSFGGLSSRFYQGETYSVSAVQYAENNGWVYNEGTINGLRNLGIGASASVSATGAVSSVSFSANGVSLTGSPSVALYTNNSYLVDNQASIQTYNNGTVHNQGAIDWGYGSINLNTAASLSISATGAVSSFSVSSVNSGAPGMYTAGSYQSVYNYGNVYNSGTLSPNGSGSVTLGRGASVSVSATGAVASFSVSGVSDNGQTLGMGAVADYGVSQYVYNDASVDNYFGMNFGAFGGSGVGLGVGASVSVSATGAVAAVSISANNSYLDVGNIGSVGQSVYNYGSVTNHFASVYFNNYSTLDTGSSVSISATGAVASTSVSAVQSNVAFVNQGYSSSYARNTGTVTNGGQVNAYGVELGMGASVSISAVGAVASRSFSAIDASDVIVPNFNGYSTQTARNYGDVTNSGYVSSVYAAGVGASVSISATGAVASHSVSAISAPLTISHLGGGYQAAYNEGAVSNGNNSTYITGEYSHDDFGAGASFSIAATGAVASWSVSSINSGIASYSGAWSVGEGIEQQSTNHGSISNMGRINLGDGYDIGRGGSVSVSATGAVASVSVSSIGNNNLSFGQFGYISQNNGDGVYNTGSVTNYSTGTMYVGAAGSSYGGALTTGASASISATGAVAAVSFSNNGGNVAGGSVSWIAQAAHNTGNVVNDSVTYNPGGPVISAGDVNTGASVSASATGAVASVGVNLLDGSVDLASFGFGNIDQTSINTGYVSNYQNSSAGIQVRDLGLGASVSIGATGAVASVSYSSLSNWGSGTTVSFGNVTQNVTNGSSGGSTGAITNTGSITVYGNLDKGASASISATGSVASFSISNVADETLVATALSGRTISQTSTNYANVSNTGSIILTNGGSTLGTGASLSLSASGSVSSASFRAVR